MPGMSETPNAARQVSDEPSPRRLLSSRKVYEGRIWDVVSDSFQLNDDGDTLVRDYIDHPGAVAVLPMNDDGDVLLLRQYRHPVGMDLWNVLADFFNSPGSSSEAIRIYLARGLGEVPGHERHVRTDEEAEIELRWTPLDEAVQAVLDGRLHNPSAVVGVLAAAAARADNFEGLRPADAPWPAHPSQRQ